MGEPPPPVLLASTAPSILRDPKLPWLQRVWTPRVRQWAGALAIVGSGNAVTQALAFAGGIIIVRMLSREQYALYTMAYAMLGTVNVLGDAGISAAVTAEGGKVWQDREKLGVVLETGRQLRWKFATIIILLTTSTLLYLLRKHGSGWPGALLLTSGVLCLYMAGLQSSLYGIPLLLHQKHRTVQRIAVVQNIARVFLLFLGLLFAPLASVAIYITGALQWIAGRQTRRAVKRFAEAHCAPDPEIRGRMSGTIQRVLPGVAYYAISGQLTVWLISLFGNSSAIAEIGALGRIGQLGLFISTIFGALIVPRFARLADEPVLLSRRYLQAIGTVAFASAGLVALTALFSSAILAILGSAYKDLRAELILMVVATGVNLVAGAAYSLALHRGWILSPWIALPISILSQLLLIAFVPLSEVSGVLLVSILSPVPAILAIVVFASMRINHLSVSEKLT